MDLLELPTRGLKHHADRLLAVVIQMIGQVQGIPVISENPHFQRAGIGCGQDEPASGFYPGVEFLQR